MPAQDVQQEEVCPVCRASFSNPLLFASHSLSHTQPSDAFHSGPNHLRLRPITAFSGLLRDYDLSSDEEVSDIPLWLRSQFPLLESAFSPLLRQFVVRGMFYVRVEFVRVNPETGLVVERMNTYIPSNTSRQIVDLREWLEDNIERFQRTLEKFTTGGSAWVVEGVDHVLFKLNLGLNYSGRGIFKLPQKLMKKQAVVNVQCERSCFKYALLSILHYKDINRNRERPSKYIAWENELNFEGVNIEEIDIARDIPKVEKLNNIKINIHVWERGLKGLRYNSRQNLAPTTINLLLVTNEQGDRHYCGIPSLSRLYRHAKNTTHNHHMCERCIRSFRTSEDLSTHYEWCRRGKAQIESMPENKEFNYKASGHELSPLRVLYADAECFIEEETKTHLPAAIGFYEVWHSNHHQQNRSKVTSYVGDDCIQNFLNKLGSMVKEQYENSNMTRQQMKISFSQQASFNRCTSCPKCKKAFSQKNIKVRDHCHITGEYRGPLCYMCNLRLRLKRNILPVIFHNLKNYDVHLLIKNGLGKMTGWRFSVIAQSTEKFMTLRASVPVGETKKGKKIYFDILFLDSYQFMPQSLASLAQNLESFPLSETLRQEYPKLNNDLIKRKGVFPYSYFSNLNKLSETCLPPRSVFKSDLTGEECSEENYEHAQNAWQLFDCKTFKDYMLAYLKLDITLLADVYEQFRKMSLTQDGLDPVHFISLPGLSFMSAFKMTNETIHLLQDPDLYSLFERGIRGGLTFVNKHRSRSRTFNTSNGVKKHIIMYIDENNLYGKALSEPLPHSNFHELSPEERLQFFPDANSILNIDRNGEKGYLFEVDLDYPSHLHNLTKDFPLAPEQGEITKEMLSPFMKDLFEKIQSERNVKTDFKSCRKLLLTQYDKTNYVVHYAMLQFYLEMGLVLSKIHRVVSFTQKRFLEPYIKFNSERRSKARNTFEKDFYKLKNNSLFGKCMEDVRKRQDYKLVNDAEKAQRFISSPFFLDRDIITEDIVGVKMVKPKVVLNKPIYIGQAVLDYSKLTMYNLFYKTLKQCPLINKISLLGGDTDSFFMQVEVDEQVTKSDILKSLEDFVDFSNYPTNHPLYSTKNKAKLGCFKDECAGSDIDEIVLLRPKMYSIQTLGGEGDVRRAKGISRALVKNMRHQEYHDAYKQLKETYVNMTILKSVGHTIHTTTFRKRALSCLEDKRCWVNCNASLPHGHVDSPVPPPKRVRVSLPAAGDV